MTFLTTTSIRLINWKIALAIPCIAILCLAPAALALRDPDYEQEGVEQALDGKLEAALKSFNMYITSTPNDPEGYVNRGNIYEQLGRRSDALKDESRAIQMMGKKSFPDKYLTATAFSNRGSLYFLSGKPAKAISDLERAIAFYPTHPNAHDYLGRVYLKQGKKAAAIEQWKLAVQYYRHEQGTKEAAELEEKIRTLEAPH